MGARWTTEALKEHLDERLDEQDEHLSSQDERMDTLAAQTADLIASRDAGRRLTAIAIAIGTVVVSAGYLVAYLVVR